MDATCPLCQKLRDVDRLPDEDVVWRFPHSIAFLGPWQRYAGYCVLVARTHVRELFDLEDGVRRSYLDEMTTLAGAIAAVVKPRKMNYEMLGNQVAHPHWHLFPRFENDPDTLKAVWLALERAEQDEQEKLRLRTGPQSRGETTRRLRETLVALGAEPSK